MQQDKADSVWFITDQSVVMVVIDYGMYSNYLYTTEASRASKLIIYSETKITFEKCILHTREAIDQKRQSRM